MKKCPWTKWKARCSWVNLQTGRAVYTPAPVAAPLTGGVRIERRKGFEVYSPEQGFVLLTLALVGSLWRPRLNVTSVPGGLPAAGVYRRVRNVSSGI